MAKATWQCPSEWSDWSEWLAAGLHARRGTASGLVDHVRLVTGGEVELLETGGTAGSASGFWSPSWGRRACC